MDLTCGLRSLRLQIWILEASSMCTLRYCVSSLVGLGNYRHKAINKSPFTLQSHPDTPTLAALRLASALSSGMDACAVEQHVITREFAIWALGWNSLSLESSMARGTFVPCCCPSFYSSHSMLLCGLGTSMACTLPQGSEP